MQYVGLRWYKCDFHLHTIWSECYKEKTDTIDMWLKEAKSKGLQCIAVTDHNDYRGIDEIKKQSDQYGIIVFPGVELSCDTSKIHMLIIFDVNDSGTEVQEFLNRVEIFKESLGNSGYTCKGDIFEVCGKAHEMGGLVIAAHIDEFNGINAMSDGNIKKLLDRTYIDAVQIVNKGIWNQYENDHDIIKAGERLHEKYGKVISDDEIKKWHKAYLLAEKSGLPMLTFSDNPCEENDPRHGLWGIGNNITWLKMDKEPNLESVRQALISSDMRVKNAYEHSGKPDLEPELWISSIKFSKTELSKKDVFVEFNPQLNAIIGGRGSGKSSIIRMLAGGMQSFDAERLTQIKEEQENFYKKLGRDKKGVFNKESTIEICFQRAGDAYRVNISNIEDMHNQLRELYRFEGEKWVKITDNNYFDFFRAQVYTQKQIYELALDSNSLLSIIDSDIENYNQKVDERETALEKVIAKWLEIKALRISIGEEDKLNTEIKDIEEQINKYIESGISAVVKKKQEYSLQEKAIESYLENKDTQTEQMRTLINKLIDEGIRCSEIDDQEISELIEKDKTLLDTRKRELSAIVDSIQKETNELKVSIANSQWKKGMEETEKRYNDLSVSLQEQGINFEKLDELLERKRNKLSDLDKIKGDKERLKYAEDERQQLNLQYEKVVKEISLLRSDFIKEVIGSDTNVKFEIQRSRNKNSFIHIMKAALQKDNATIEEDINKLADIYFGKDGIRKFRKLMWDIREEDDKKSCSGRMRTAICDMTPESFARIISFLPEDDLKVSYRPENAKKYIPLSNASAGQKTTAILTFLLAHGKLPLLLDQPEDDLDNKLVYDLIVTRLKKTKSNRQIIVVTHNANIPVNADAEYIVSMDSETDEIDTKYVGTMDDENIRKEICDVMEGTQYAFEMRAKKYHFRIIE